jgi:hypothetical protein
MDIHEYFFKSKFEYFMYLLVNQFWFPRRLDELNALAVEKAYDELNALAVKKAYDAEESFFQ